MRIIAGKFKGRALKTPKGDEIRPTSDRLRETLFNIIHSNYGGVEGKNIIDLCAGTGAFGLEALSRGARFCAFVDIGPEARGLLRENSINLGVTGISQILKRDARKLGNVSHFIPFDILFCDPPYGHGLGHEIFENIVQTGWAKPDALFILEERKNAPFILPQSLQLLDKREYGETVVYFLTRITP